MDACILSPVIFRNRKECSPFENITEEFAHVHVLSIMCTCNFCEKMTCFAKEILFFAHKVGVLPLHSCLVMHRKVCFYSFLL
jgi:hypothetical protein